MSTTTLSSRVLCAALFSLLAWAATPLTTQAQLPDYLPTEGLVGWWPFNGNANDESGNGNDGVVNGATLTEDRDGNPNAAYYFSGSGCSTRIDANVNTTSINGELTLSIWVLRVGSGCIGPRYFEAWPGSDSVSLLQLGWDNSLNYPSGVSHLVAVNQNGDVFGPTGLTTSSFSEVDDNTWTHIVYVNDGDNAYLWQDGVLRSTGSNPLGSAVQLASNIAIGRMNHPAYDALNGKIDDIAIYNRALTPEEITALYTGQPAVTPCADPSACNFQQEGECVYPEANLDCAGNCLNDFNNNGVCDEVEVYGCTYSSACNYNPDATSDDGTCTAALPNYDCAGNCLLDLNNNGLCDLEEVAGCTNIDAINYNTEATLDDGSCMVTCKGDFDNDGQITINDLLGFLASFGNQCAGAGCMDPAGCNYDPNATFDLGYCEYPAEFFNCDGAPINDADGDGIPDELEVAGCTDPEAGNYNPDATDDNGSCTFGLTGSTHSCGAENVHNPELLYGSVTDIDGNTYRTIVIGEQEWMAENLTVEHYANGDPIPQVTGGAEWANLSTGAWCYYNNGPTYECPYGKLYNWYVTIDDRNVCPTGWHVPTDAEYSLLTEYLGGEAVAGGKMKSTGTQYWINPNTAATNESGFSGLPGGYRGGGSGAFGDVVSHGYWWSSTENDTDSAWNHYLNYANGNVTRDSDGKADGFSVRCLRD